MASTRQRMVNSGVVRVTWPCF